MYSDVVRGRVVVGRRTRGSLGFTDERGEREQVRLIVRPAEYQFLVLFSVELERGKTAECVPSHVVQPRQYCVLGILTWY